MSFSWMELTVGTATSTCCTMQQPQTAVSTQAEQAQEQKQEQKQALLAVLEL